MAGSFCRDSGRSVGQGGPFGRKARRPIVGDAGVALHLTTNLFLGSKEMGERILSFLIMAGQDFTPEYFDRGEPYGKTRLDAHDLSLPLQGWVDNRYSLGIIATRSHPFESSLLVHSTDFLMFDHVNLSIESSWFSSLENVDRFQAVAKGLYSITSANSGYIQNWRHERRNGEITDEAGNLVGFRAPRVKTALSGLFWANLFGPEYVRMFGKDKLLSAPWYKHEELSDGGLLLLISASPLDAAKPEYQSLKKQIYAHLGEGAFTGAILPEFRTEGRKKRDARPLIQSGGFHDDIFR